MQLNMWDARRRGLQDVLFRLHQLLMHRCTPAASVVVVSMRLVQVAGGQQVLTQTVLLSNLWYQSCRACQGLQLLHLALGHLV
jgi:hypothetical protein